MGSKGISTALYCLLILALTSCSSSVNETELSDNEVYLIYEFKKAFFSRCLKYGYNSNEAVSDILSEDVSLAGDFPLGVAGYRLIDSIAWRVREQIIGDSINLRSRRDYEVGRKRVLMHCLNAYDSDSLEQLALDYIRNNISREHD